MTEEKLNGESTSSALSETEKKIVDQIEYYFGNINLPKDKFLQEEVKKDDGWVEIETLTRFNRLKTLTTDCEIIAGALQKSSGDIVEMSEDKKKVRRSPKNPLPISSMEYWLKVKQRSVYVKGFPEDMTLTDIQEFFKPFGKLENIIMRRDPKNPEKSFKGSVFATFPTRDEAIAFVNQEGVKIGEADAIKSLQEDYYKRKTEEKRKEKDRKRQQKEEAEKKLREEAAKERLADITHGLILQITGITEESENKAIRDKLKESLGKFATVAWVDYSKQNSEAFIRFDGEENEAERVIEKVKKEHDGKFVVDGKELECQVLKGEEETEHWKKAIQSQLDSRARSRENKMQRDRSRRGGGRGGRGGGPRVQERRRWNKRKTFNDDDDEDDEKNAETKTGEEPSVKKTKVESSDVPDKEGEQVNGEQKKEVNSDEKKTETT